MTFSPPGSSKPSAPPFRPPRGKDRPAYNPPQDGPRVNERIRVPQVRLIDENGGQVGVVATHEALRMARDRNLDLMEVAPNANPPVCKIADYGKYKYEQKKKEQAARKKQVVIKVKEIQLRPNTEDHDIDYKVKAVRGFLDEGDKAKISMLFRGREMAHTEGGFKVMHDIIQQLQDVAIIESPPKMEGRKLLMILAPAPKKAGGGSGPAKKSDEPIKPVIKPAIKPANKSET